MNLVETITDLDSYAELHAARLLILIFAFVGKEEGTPVEGLTKLAKLDFLLRYPVMLERALREKRKSSNGVKLMSHERLSVESEMVRYRFGPWDHRYRQFLNILVAKHLATVSVSGKKVVVALTTEGTEKAIALSELPEFEDYARRSEILKRHFDVQGTSLMKFIYSTFPEVVTLRTNESIPT